MLKISNAAPDDYKDPPEAQTLQELETASDADSAPASAEQDPDRDWAPESETVTGPALAVSGTDSDVVVCSGT